LLLSYCDRGERSGNAYIPISEPTSRQPTGCHLSCESSAFQGLLLELLQQLASLNLSCKRHFGPSAGSGTLLLSYCDRGECRDHACVGMTEPTSRQPAGCHLSCESSAFQGHYDYYLQAEHGSVLISLARVVLFREYPSGSRINRGLQAAVGNNCTEKHLLRVIFFTKS